MEAPAALFSRTFFIIIKERPMQALQTTDNGANIRAITVLIKSMKGTMSPDLPISSDFGLFRLNNMNKAASSSKMLKIII